MSIFSLRRNDIKRIQIMSKKKALLRGKNQGELIRLKQTLRKQNDIIKNAKNKAADGGQVSPSVYIYSSRILKVSETHIQVQVERMMRWITG
jgi:hypothetical protein